MWPGRPPARARTSSVPASARSIRPEQQRRIQIALNGAIEADALPCLVERRPPVGADDVAAGFAQLGENRPGADAEMNERHIGRRELARRCAACGAG